MTGEEALKIVRLYRGECQMMLHRLRPEVPEAQIYTVAVMAAKDIELRLKNAIEHGVETPTRLPLVDG